MDNFTNSGLTELLIQVIRHHDPDIVSSIRAIHPMTRAVQSDTPKRQVAQTVLEKHGPGMLLRVGQHLRDIDPTPVFTALTSTLEPNVIAAKWMRLERYNHSSHRTEIDITTPGRWRCARTSKSTPATSGENYLIVGVLFGLLTLTGVSKPTLRLDHQTLTPSTLHTAKRSPRTSADAFDITWKPTVKPAVAACKEPSRPTTTSQILMSLFAQDTAKGWHLNDAARALGKSARTLQRDLNREGNSYSTVLRRARTDRAISLLSANMNTLAEIGYCCGYADQAHFQRDFRTVANVTPSHFIRILNNIIDA